jgi:hypothetical protein
VRTILWLHVAGGGLSLLAGFAALYTAKGSRRHRSIGRVFVYAMVTMASSGVGIAAVTGVETSVVMGTFAAYLVFTGMTAVSPLATGHRWINLAAAAVAFTLAVALANLGRRALASPDGVVEGLPALMAFIFAVVAILAGASDIRLLVGPQLRGGGRLARHLWRMCFALFIAAASFFLGQGNAIPQPLRSPVLLSLPVITPILAMTSWLWRIRTRRSAMAVASPSPADAA